MVKLGKMCEKTLFREFSSSLQEINYNFKQVELLNFEESDDFDSVVDGIKIDVIDFKQIFGAKIDRAENKIAGLSTINSGRKNFEGYVPGDVKWGD